MPSTPKSHVPHGRGPGRHEGTDQHGWSPDVDSTHTEDNPSARRSFDTPEKDTSARRAPSVPPADTDSGTPVESTSPRGEDAAGGGTPKGHHDLGPRGRSQRPSGGKDDDAYTGVDAGRGPKGLRKG
ncbi:hypothetical protein WDV06_29745 [Streptomyces racemochromogenes]|uniref:Uncharacterized protein n=1 Tax=Streptomyces racemochromogenes TaxID=67353 RepID=A0ABW7PLT0_9ACTN